MACTVDVHMNQLIEDLKGKILYGGRILETTDGCAAKQYKCSTAFYFMSYLSYRHNLVIDRAIGCPGHGKYSVCKCILSNSF